MVSDSMEFIASREDRCYSGNHKNRCKITTVSVPEKRCLGHKAPWRTHWASQTLELRYGEKNLFYLLRSLGVRSGKRVQSKDLAASLGCDTW